MPTECAYCPTAATDRCPGCHSPLCRDHGDRHQGRLDGGCDQFPTPIEAAAADMLGVQLSDRQEVAS